MKAAAVYRVTRKASDLWFNSYVCRPIAALFVSGVQGTRITPNQITFLSFGVAALASVVLLGVPGRLGLLLGVAGLELAYVLDCADGMLARLRGKASSTGHLLDFLMDELKAFLLLGVATIRLFLESRQASFLIWGVCGLVALASGIALTTFTRRPELLASDNSTDKKAHARQSEELDEGRVPRVDPLRREPSPPSLLRRAVRWVEAVAKFLIHYPSYIWAVACFGRLDWYVYPYVVVNALYAARALLGVALRFGRFET